jgi:pimeloyl-ACP methyl ester carboxylesterase
MQEIHLKIPRRDSGENDYLSAIQYSLNLNTRDLDKKRPLIIFTHGFSGDKNSHGRFPYAAGRLVEDGFDVLCFDFLGSGENPLEPILLSKEIENVEDVYTWAKQQGYEQIGTVGHSLGSLASVMANLPDRKVAVFWAPGFCFGTIKSPLMLILMKIRNIFTKKPMKMQVYGNPPILIDHKFHLEYAQLKKYFGKDLKQILGEFHTPSLIIQGTKDRLIRPSTSKKSIQLMPQDEHHKLVLVEGGVHDFKGEILQKFTDYTIEWIKKYIKF